MRRYWPELAGTYYGKRGERLQDANVAEALYFTYAYFLEVTELRDAARKALEDYLTKDLEELAQEVVDNTPMTDLAGSMAHLWDEFESEAGLTREPKEVD